MSGSAPPLPSGLSQSQASLLGPGIINLFIQGIESGLVFAKFFQWLSAFDDRRGSSLLSTIVVFVTLVGLAQSGVSFISAWSKYVRHFGVLLPPDWPDYLQLIPTLLISAPVQALMIRRCYYLAGKTLFIVTPLVLILLATIAMSLWSTTLLIRLVISMKAKNASPSIENTGLSWLYLTSILLPSVLDLILTGIFFHHLTRSKKQVYAPHRRKGISHLANVAWQSALPPTFCTVGLCVIYVQFSAAHREDLDYWPEVIQAAIGKLYVLSLFYMIDAQTLLVGGLPEQSDEKPTSTLTVPTEVFCTRTQDLQVADVASSDTSGECRSAVDSVV